MGAAARAEAAAAPGCRERRESCGLNAHKGSPVARAVAGDRSDSELTCSLQRCALDRAAGYFFALQWEMRQSWNCGILDRSQGRHVWRGRVSTVEMAHRTGNCGILRSCCPIHVPDTVSLLGVSGRMLRNRKASAYSLGTCCPDVAHCQSMVDAENRG